LDVEKRDERGHSARHGAGKRIPAIVYGHGMDPIALWVDMPAFARVFGKAGETAVIELIVDGAKKTVPTIVRDLQHDPIKHTITHIDFYKVDLKEAVTADVPIVLTGEAPAVKLGGTIMQGINTIEVSALPSDLPQEIVIDISQLESFDDSITISDIVAPKNVTFVSDPSLLVVSIAPPRVEEEAQDTDVTEEAEEASTEDTSSDDHEKSAA